MPGKKVAFLFGAGAEMDFGLPSGGRFAIDIFRSNFDDEKKMLGRALKSDWATELRLKDWLPKQGKTNRLYSMGGQEYKTILSSTINNRKDNIVNAFRDFNSVMGRALQRISYNGNILDDNGMKELYFETFKFSFDANKYHDKIEFGDSLEENKLFSSEWLSSFLTCYESMEEGGYKNIREVEKFITGMIQISLAAHGENAIEELQRSFLSAKDHNVPIISSLGNLFKLDLDNAGEGLVQGILSGQGPQDSSNGFDYFHGLIFYASEIILEDVMDYRDVIDNYFPYLFNPSSDWAKFSKIWTFLHYVHKYMLDKVGETPKNNHNYYSIIKQMVDEGHIDIEVIGTVNYTPFVRDEFEDVQFLHGSLEDLVDPYRVFIHKDGLKDENIFSTPMLFTQSGTKAMSSVQISERFVDFYRKSKMADVVIIIGYNASSDDFHINSILRMIAEEGDKKVKIIKLVGNEYEKVENFRENLKIKDGGQVEFCQIQYGWVQEEAGRELLRDAIIGALPST